MTFYQIKTPANSYLVRKKCRFVLFELFGLFGPKKPAVAIQISANLCTCQLYLVVRSKRERTSASRGFLTKAQIAFYLHALSLKSLFQVGTVKVKCRAFCLLHPYITVKVAQGKRHSILNICTRQIQFFRHPRPLQFNNTASGLDVLVAATSKKTNQVGADGIGVIALIRDSAVSQYARLASLHAFLKFFLRAVQWALLHQFGEADRICEDGHVGKQAESLIRAIDTNTIRADLRSVPVCLWRRPNTVGKPRDWRILLNCQGGVGWPETIGTTRTMQNGIFCEYAMAFPLCFTLTVSHVSDESQA